ncbi:MAG: sigma factor-like helix-turn-helix DNA-binding protein [SAR202 cluster bacterium]|jgi:RNA polymerase sigma-70 factor (ECF subfamily)|nr:sigma factor-like helix-turn-helix DNA-binding protein [SAR202 cluster bacterium]MDP7103057.1 sigma factor-like helix-turn-helix DNA-binding protein [SAR202 cluster bacterium]MDP7224577.1 sigma factor-like helix-turn-helix DNA-binding protein [SAR202 cluster bacterium]MDP7413917.1 sigma factor-like helix-turn-helix DNA-binding protein [SAR202 cluster bacterium]MDP7532447.1 sigma factor-like helix-turn-helix DNA-binding protein [SAR202 cluster bacterium]
MCLRWRLNGLDDEREAYSWVKAMVDELPPAYREAILLTEYDGISQREMSRQLGISFSGAKSRVQRARAKLKDKLLDCCHFELDRRGGVIDYRSKESVCGCSSAPNTQAAIAR